MKYVEIGATYEVLVPEDWEDAYDSPEFTVTTYKNFWDGRLFTVESSSGKDKSERNYLHGTSPGRPGRCTIYQGWLHKLVKHCPQVEYYIASQKQKEKSLPEKETYLSPFTGQIA